MDGCHPGSCEAGMDGDQGAEDRHDHLRCSVSPRSVFAAHGYSLWTAVVLLGLAGAAHQAWSANLFTTVSDMFPKAAIASVTGIGGMAGAGVGMLFPFLTGKLLDSFEIHRRLRDHLPSVPDRVYSSRSVFHHFLAPKLVPFELKNLR